MTVREVISSFAAANAAWWRQLVLRRDLSRGDVDFGGLHERVHSEHEPVLVLNPGRSGSMLLTRLLELDESIHAVHEPKPELEWHNTFALEHPDDVSRLADIFDAARYEAIRDTHLEGKRYVETNNRITFFAHAAHLLYPKARFIHLVRNPVSFVRSGLARSWYSGTTLYDASRPRKHEAGWDDMDRLEKIAWLWETTHSFIEEFKVAHSECVHTVVAEQLFKDPHVTLDIFRFLGLRDPSDSKVRTIIGRKVNPHRGQLTAMNPIDEARILALAPSAARYYSKPLSR